VESYSQMPGKRILALEFSNYIQNFCNYVIIKIFILRGSVVFGREFDILSVFMGIKGWCSAWSKGFDGVRPILRT
jgi:hypothetical protein